jgi:hypothetical protein
LLRTIRGQGSGLGSSSDNFILVNNEMAWGYVQEQVSRKTPTPGPAPLPTGRFINPTPLPLPNPHNAHLNVPGHLPRFGDAGLPEDLS